MIRAGPSSSSLPHWVSFRPQAPNPSPSARVDSNHRRDGSFLLPSEYVHLSVPALHLFQGAERSVPSHLINCQNPCCARAERARTGRVAGEGREWARGRGWGAQPCKKH